MSANSIETTWTVVHFIDEDDAVEAVPTGWIQGDLCYWPPWTRTKLTEAIKKSESLNTCWPVHKIKLFRNATFDNYISARLKAQKACHTSDLNSTDNEGNKRRRIKRKIFDPSDSESDDSSTVLPLPPKISLKTAMHNERTQEKNMLENQLNQNKNNLIDNTANNVIQTQKHCCCAEIKKMFEGMSDGLTKKLSSIKAGIYQLIEDVSNQISVASATAAEEIAENFHLKFNCPIDNEATLAEAELYLKDHNNFKQAVHQIRKLGGKDAYDIIKRYFISTISDKISKEFTFDGTKQKRAFKDTNICALFIAASNLDIKTVETAVRKWLRRSSERDAYKNRNINNFLNKDK